MDVSALTASMGIKIRVILVKQIYCSNDTFQRAGLRRNALAVLPVPGHRPLRKVFVFLCCKGRSMAILPEASRLWSFCFWLFCSSQDPIAIARKGADPTWMKGVDWRHPRLMDSEWGGWAYKQPGGRVVLA